MASDPSMAKSNAAVAKAKADNSGRVYRVYCDGIFDMFHVGHMLMLKQAKQMLGPNDKTYLMVGVCSDELTHKFKGKTVMNHKIRCDSAENCKWTDEVIPEAPWVLTTEFLEKHKIDFVAHDALPYNDTSGTSADGDVYGPIKKKGMFMETQRTKGISTSDLIVQIVRDYDAYVQRNLDRGYSLKDLNVGRTWEIRRVEHEKREQIKEALEDTKEEYSRFVDAAEAFAEEFRLRGRSPVAYAKSLCSTLPSAGNGVLHHLGGLATALFEIFKSLLSYLNPFAYFGSKSVTLALVVLLVALFWNTLSQFVMEASAKV